MSPGGALAVSVMPQVGPRWGRPVDRDTRGVNSPCYGPYSVELQSLLPSMASGLLVEEVSPMAQPSDLIANASTGGDGIHDGGAALLRPGSSGQRLEVAEQSSDLAAEAQFGGSADVDGDGDRWQGERRRVQLLEGDLRGMQSSNDGPMLALADSAPIPISAFRRPLRAARCMSAPQERDPVGPAAQMMRDHRPHGTS